MILADIVESLAAAIYVDLRPAKIMGGVYLVSLFLFDKNDLSVFYYRKKNDLSFFFSFLVLDF